MSRSFALRISTSFTRASTFMVIGFEPGTHVKSSGYTFVYCVTSLLQSSSKDQNVSDKTAVAYELVDCNFCSAVGQLNNDHLTLLTSHVLFWT
ncbi:hypothetical protein T06_9726 [Trichinella sp. T6]|nr:hypothetical protein T06_9726 [Trichinella sp. T6]